MYRLTPCDLNIAQGVCKLEVCLSKEVSEIEEIRSIRSEGLNMPRTFESRNL